MTDNTAAAETRYLARFRRVLEHIDRAPDGDLSVTALSGIAAFSPWHFHRQFSSLTGMGLHAYRQGVRLRRASLQLAYRPTLSVTEIALAAGFEAPEAFARAFRKLCGLSPAAFRRSPDFRLCAPAFAPITTLRSRLMPSPFSSEAVEISLFPATPVGLINHEGDPARLGETISRFIGWRRANGLPPSRSATFNIAWVNPEETPPEDFRFGLAAATHRAIAPNDFGVSAFTLPGGRCARYRHVGDDSGLRDAILGLYRDWLPGSGEELRDFPVFWQRVSFFPDVPEIEAVSDIFLPLV